MTDCTHTEHPPCARCEIEEYNQRWLLGTRGHEDDLVEIIEKHAAAAYERGRREAFEEAAELIGTWCYFLTSEDHDHGACQVWTKQPAAALRHRAAEERSDGTD